MDYTEYNVEMMDDCISMVELRDNCVLTNKKALYGWIRQFKDTKVNEIYWVKKLRNNTTGETTFARVNYESIAQ